MGDALLILADNGRAIDCFRQALNLADRGSPLMLEAYYGLLTSLGATDAERAEQLALCIQALEVFPTDAQLLCALAGYLQAQGKLPVASQAYLYRIQIWPSQPNRFARGRYSRHCGGLSQSHAAASPADGRGGAVSGSCRGRPFRIHSLAALSDRDLHPTRRS